MRLEFSVAIITVRISVMLQKGPEIPNLQEFFWTDTTVVIFYINHDSRRFEMFVTKHIQRIKQILNHNKGLKCL